MVALAVELEIDGALGPFEETTLDQVMVDALAPFRFITLSSESLDRDRFTSLKDVSARRFGLNGILLIQIVKLHLR